MNLEAALMLETLDGLDSAESLDAIALMVDHAMDTGDLELNSRALDWADALETILTADIDLAKLDYYRANAWANYSKDVRQDRAKAWAWEQESLEQQLLLLRRALNREAFKDLPILMQCQILTNLGNQLNFAGRFVEAHEFWTRAVDTLPDFWMAQFNRGYGLMTYARCLYDDGHRYAFALTAYTDMVDAIRKSSAGGKLPAPMATQVKCPSLW